MAKKPGHKQHKQYSNKFNKDLIKKKKQTPNFLALPGPQQLNKIWVLISMYFNQCVIS